LLGDDDSSASETEAEVDDVSLRAENAVPDAGLFNSPETAVDSTTPTLPSPDGWHDIDDFHETAPLLRLAEQRPTTPNSLRPHTLLRASRASHYTTASVQKDLIHAAPDPRSRPPLASGARLASSKAFHLHMSAPHIGRFSFLLPQHPFPKSTSLPPPPPSPKVHNQRSRQRSRWEDHQGKTP
jgi:hypothetical protein